MPSVSPDARAAIEEREVLQAQVAGLFLTFFDQLHTGPAGPWLELDLTMPQLKMLFVVDWLGAAPMSQVAARLGITVSTATGLTDRLVEGGLARREHDPKDRRVVRVCTTAAGRALVVRLRSAGSERLGQLLDRLDADELRCCARALQSINGAAEAAASLDLRFPTALSAAGHAEAEL